MKINSITNIIGVVSYFIYSVYPPAAIAAVLAGSI